jgi:hypothetical protein
VIWGLVGSARALKDGVLVFEADVVIVKVAVARLAAKRRPIIGRGR